MQTIVHLCLLKQGQKQKGLQQSTALDIFLPAGSFELLKCRTIFQSLKENFRLLIIKSKSVFKPGCHNTVGGQTHSEQNRLCRHFSLPKYTQLQRKRPNLVPLPRASPNRPTEWKLSYCKMLNQLVRVLSGTRCASEANSPSNTIS